MAAPVMVNRNGLMGDAPPPIKTPSARANAAPASVPITEGVASELLALTAVVDVVEGRIRVTEGAEGGDERIEHALKAEFEAFPGRVAGIDGCRQRRRSGIYSGALEVGVVVMEDRSAPVEAVLEQRAFQADLIVPDDFLFEFDGHVAPADE